jgi:hypothetical protein
MLQMATCSLGEVFKTAAVSFHGPVDIVSSRSNSVVVFDEGTAQFAALDGKARIMQNWPGASAADSTWTRTALYRRSFLRTLSPASATCGRTFATLMTKEPEYRLYDVVQAETGTFWVREVGGTGWSVRTGANMIVARLNLPADVEVVQVDQDGLVGVLSDGNTQRIRIFHLSGPGPQVLRSRVLCSATGDSSNITTPRRVAEIKATIRKALQAAERMHEQVGHYVLTFDSLGVQLPIGAEARILGADQKGWSLAVFDQSSFLVCVVGLGFTRPVGWLDGVIRCGQ